MCLSLLRGCEAYEVQIYNTRGSTVFQKLEGESKTRCIYSILLWKQAREFTKMRVA